jgi:hypothetical protein
VSPPGIVTALAVLLAIRLAMPAKVVSRHGLRETVLSDEGDLEPR